MKHRLKLLLGDAYVWTLTRLGLCGLVDRLMPRRLLILAGHCVAAPSNAALAGDMKIDAERLRSILAGLARRYEVTSVGEGWRRLAEPGRRSLVALSMDDGYADNRTHLLPLLRELGLPATIYLESEPLDGRALNWSHLYFWLLDRLGAAGFVEAYARESGDERAVRALEELARDGRATSYHLKRVLKYEAEPAERTRAVRALFAAQGGDERALCDGLYMTWDDARALHEAGIELGGHTRHHEILARLDADGQRAEVADGRRSIERATGAAPASFAYPFGRRWDFDARSREAARAAGFATAATTHAGTNFARDDPYALRRVMIDENARADRIAVEACGGFDLLRRLGIDLNP